jgi:hypothetical protein
MFDAVDVMTTNPSPVEKPAYQLYFA